jgi:hypothetical protein
MHILDKVRENVFLNLPDDIWKLILNLVETLSWNRIATDPVSAFVDVGRLLKEDTVDTSHQLAWWKVKLHLLDVIQLIANKERTFNNEEYLVDFFQLVVDNRVITILSQLQWSHHLNHERLIVWIRPFVVAVFLSWVLLNLEERFECLDEFLEQIVLEQIQFTLRRQLIKESQISIPFEATQFVILPVELEEYLGWLSQLNVQSFTSVENLNHVKEQVKIFCFLIFSIDLFDLFPWFCELSNNNVEQGNSKDEDATHD